MRPLEIELGDSAKIRGKVSWHDNEEARMGVYARILKRLFDRRVNIKNEMATLKQQSKREGLGEKERADIGVRLDILDT
jgi:DNA polymerase elongation subunit (family B)